MNNTNRHFDFSLDAAFFRERLKKQLLSATAESVEALDDNELEYIYAAGTVQSPPSADDVP